MLCKNPLYIFLHQGEYDTFNLELENEHPISYSYNAE
jgi:hypothetical protein